MWPGDQGGSRKITRGSWSTIASTMSFLQRSGSAKSLRLSVPSGSGDRAAEQGRWLGSDSSLTKISVLAETYNASVGSQSRLFGKASPAAMQALGAGLRFLPTFIVSAGILLGHVVVIPLLPFLPLQWESIIEEWLRSRVLSRQLPLPIIWFFPAGRFALWACTTTLLACLLTAMPPIDTDLPSATACGLDGVLSMLGVSLEGGTGAWPAWFLSESRLTSSLDDVVLLCYAVGWALAEISDLLGTASRKTYFRDVFNVLDLALIFAMGMTISLRIIMPDSFDLALPIQSIAAMLAWLRLLQLLYIFPSTGPMLIMTIRMLNDLISFLLLASFIILAFGAAFFVLIARSTASAYSNHRVLHSSRGASAPGISSLRSDSGTLTFASVLTLLLEGALDGEPDRIMEVMGGPHVLNFTWVVMALFGIVVVLLLLNLLIARFAKTFDVVHENLDANFKVAFARVVLKGASQELVPPPFNLLRRTMLLCYSVLASFTTLARSLYVVATERDEAVGGAALTGYQRMANDSAGEEATVSGAAAAATPGMLASSSAGLSIGGQGKSDTKQPVRSPLIGIGRSPPPPPLVSGSSSTEAPAAAPAAVDADQAAKASSKSAGGEDHNEEGESKASPGMQKAYSNTYQNASQQQDEQEKTGRAGSREATDELSSDNAEASSAEETNTDGSDHSMSNDEVRKIYEFVRKASSPAVRLYPDIVEQWALCQVNAISNEEAWRADFAKQLAKVDLQLKELLRRDSNWESKRVSNSTTVTAAAPSVVNAPSEVPRRSASWTSAMARMPSTGDPAVAGLQLMLEEMRAQLEAQQKELAAKDKLLSAAGTSTNLTA